MTKGSGFLHDGSIPVRKVTASQIGIVFRSTENLVSLLETFLEKTNSTYYPRALASKRDMLYIVVILVLCMSVIQNSCRWLACAVPEECTPWVLSMQDESSTRMECERARRRK